MNKKNLLLVIEGNHTQKPDAGFFAQAGIGKVFLLYVSSPVKAEEHLKELRAVIGDDIPVEILRSKDLVDFFQVRTKLIDFIAALPGRLTLKGRSLSQYLEVDGLNLWWASGIVEKTAYKRDLLQNFYYLSVVRSAISRRAISAVWFQAENRSFSRDLLCMLKREGIESFFRDTRGVRKGLASLLTGAKTNFLFFAGHLVYSSYFKIIFPKALLPVGSKRGRGKGIHLFWTYFPSEVRFRRGRPQTKIYQELPEALSGRFAGKDCYLTYISPFSLSHFRRIVKRLKVFWNRGFSLIPIDICISPFGVLKAFLSPERYIKYFHLRRSPSYRKAFVLDGIDMHTTFDAVMRDSLTGVEASTNLLYYYAFRWFAQEYAQDIHQVMYPLEFHNWEVAVISGIKSVDQNIPVLGLQQSAPNPILLSFYFAPEMFKDPLDRYPLPDAVFSSGQLYKDLFISGGMEQSRVEVVGHIADRYLDLLPLSQGEKGKKRRSLGLPPDKKICLVAGSISSPLSEAMLYLLKGVVPRLPDVFFLIKPHPQCPLEGFLSKYSLAALGNIKSTQHAVSELLAVADYFLATSTSVSQEALRAGVAQINLDVGGLPFANPLHLIPGFIADARTDDELMDFFLNTQKFALSREQAALFIGEPHLDPVKRIVDFIEQRFNRLETGKEKDESDHHRRRDGLALESLNK